MARQALSLHTHRCRGVMGRTEDYKPETNIFGLDVAGSEAYFGWEAKGDQEAGTGALAHHRLLLL